MRFFTVCTAVSAWIILKCTAIIIITQYYTEITLLILIIDLYSVSVFLTLEALYETAVFMIELTIFELTLKEQSLINECISLCWWNNIHNQTCYCLVKLDSFFESLHMQNLNSFLEMLILLCELLYYLLLLDAVQND